MQVGDKVIVREEGPWFGEEGIVTGLASANIKGPGFNLDVREELQKAEVKIYGGAIGIFVSPADLEVQN